MFREILLYAAIQKLDLDLSSELDSMSCFENFEGGCASVPVEELPDGEFCPVCEKWRDIHAVERLLSVMDGNIES